jgi:hypothetical protein
LSRVVFPAPKNPVNTVTGTGAIISVVVAIRHLLLTQIEKLLEHLLLEKIGYCSSG